MNTRDRSELLERGGEVAALGAALTAAKAGRDALVVVLGDAGIGKSSLLAAVRADGAARGLTVLAAVGTELDRYTPFSVVTHLLGRAVADPHRAGSLLVGQAALAAPLFDGTVPLPADSDALLRGLYWLVATLAATARDGLLIVVDDAHWVDRASLRFLLHLAGRLDGLPVALVVAAREGEPGAPADLLDRLVSLPNATVLPVLPLTTEAAGQLVRQAVPAADDAFVAACARVSGGNPFLLREVLEEAAGTGMPPRGGCSVERTVPAAVRRSVLARLAGLPDAARLVAGAVAVLGPDAELRRAALLVGLTVEEAGTAADVLVGARILDEGTSLRFVHPLLAGAVHDDLPPFARARAHRRAADILVHEGAPAAAVASHLLQAPPSGDEATVRLLTEAAASAVARGEPASAVQLLRRALAEPPGDDQLLDVLVDLGTAQARSDDRDAGATLERALGAARNRDERVRALTARAAACYGGGDVGGLLRYSGEALDLLDPDDPRGQRLLADYLAAGLFHAPSRFDAERRTAAVLARAAAGAPPENPALLALLAVRSAFSGESPEEVRRLAQGAVAADPLVDPGAHGLFLSLVVQALVTVDELTAAEQLAAGGMSAARLRGDELSWTVAGFHRALPRYHRGDLDGALADLEPAVQRRQDGGSGADGFLALQLVLLHLARDDVASARAAAEHADATPADFLDHHVAVYAKGLLALAEGRPDVAADAGARAGRDLDVGFGIDHPGFVAWRCLVARSAHAMGDDRRARAMAAQAVERARWSAVPRVLACALRTAAAVGEGAASLRLLHEAVQTVEDSPAELERTAVLVDLGAATRAAGHTEEARRTLLQAYATAERLGARALVRRSRRELHALGLRPRRAATGLDALTPSERRVAELVAEGMSNQQVAEGLFVTRKTVETHLAAVYRKLGVRNRAELRGHLPADGSARSPRNP